jgi:hypothetical protein
MTNNHVLHETFVENEHRAPDSSQILQSIRAELNRTPHRRVNRLGPLFVVAAVVAIAVGVPLSGSTPHHSARPSASPHISGPALTSPSVSNVVPNTDALATSAARTILRSVPLPPGARALDHVNPVLGGASLQLSSLQAVASGVWRVSGTLSTAVDFALTHPAPGFTPNCTCGGAKVKWIDFYSQDHRRAINYVIQASTSGVEIGITAIVPWVPDRPSWSLVPASATSVDVTVQRVRSAGSTGGAPTVHRTLSADATQHLAATANALLPQAESNCRGPMIMIAATDTLIFHADGNSYTFTMPATNCPQFSIQASGHKTTYVEVGTLDTALLTALGLPANYGH